MTKFTVSWSCEIDAESEDHAVHQAFRKMQSVAGIPQWGDNELHIVNDETGEQVDINIIDALLKVDPILVSQIFGFRHMIWVSQGQGRA